MNEWNPLSPKVPVGEDGNWLGYAFHGHKNWELVTPFYAELEILSMYTGRSAKGLVLRDVDTGREFPMFISDLVDVFQNETLVVIEHTQAGGRLKGQWTACKRGSNYGIRAVRE